MCATKVSPQLSILEMLTRFQSEQWQAPRLLVGNVQVPFGYLPAVLCLQKQCRMIARHASVKSFVDTTGDIAVTLVAQDCHYLAK
jgi:hypothetical protein